MDKSTYLLKNLSKNNNHTYLSEIGHAPTDN